MPYTTTALNHSNTYTLQCITAVGNCACTIVSIKSSGAMSAENLISPNVSGKSVPTGAARLIFHANAPTGQTGVFKITQSGITLIDEVIGGSAPVDRIFVIEVS